METTLNLIWLLLAAALVRLWMSHAKREGSRLHIQVTALAVLILILFPVISVTDDRAAAQNPAEVDSCLRRNHDLVAPHAIFPAVALLTAALLADLSLESQPLTEPSCSGLPAIHNPAFASIENRPPPAA